MMIAPTADWLRRRWRRIRAWFRARIRERITRTGAAYIIAAALVGLSAFLSANNLLFLLLAAMLATLLVSGFISRLGLASLELDVQLPDHLCARKTLLARIELHNDKRWFPSFSVHLTGIEGSVFGGSLYFPVIPGGATLKESMPLRFEHRGLHSEDSFQFSSRFPFGFAERRMQVTMKRDVIVYPALDPQPGFEEILAEVQGEAETHFRGRGHDFYRIRPYEPFESARNVDWRATAHTGQLQVREFAQDQEHLIEIALDLLTPDEHRAWFEHAVECCAYLAWRLTARGARVRLRTQDFDLLSPVEGDVYDILKYLALVQRRRRESLITPSADDCVQILFTTRANSLTGAGWQNARIVSPGDLPLPAESGATGA